MDITEEILHQHGEQRRMFAFLDELPRDDIEGLAALWRRLEIFLETHAEAEERYFYPLLVNVGTGAADADDVEEEVEDAVKDHNDIRDAIRKVARHETGSEDWWDAVIECRVANSEHMAEEERQDLADFRKHTDLSTRHDVALKFVRFQALHAAEGIEPEDKDPEQYLEDAKD